MRSAVLTVILAYLVTVVLVTFGLALGAGTSKEDTIESVSVNPNGYVVVLPESGSWNNPDGCDRSGKAIIPVLDDTSKWVYSAVLSAHVSRRPVKLHFRGCAVSAGKTYPLIVGVKVE